MAFEVWQPGMIMTEERMASISPTWEDWVPTWVTSSGSATPSFGNAVLTCRYALSATTCCGKFDVAFGSTTSFGTSPTTGDNWRFGLPVAASALHNVAGFAELNASTGARVVARIRLTTTAAFELEVSSGRPDATAVAFTGLVDALTPWTWTSGNTIRGTFQYEIAN
ncbi:hypothetical protein ABT063_24830 [Streptomyces sp. NPDC002838]|uniref:hypothetical protein n=1 Tax=Streptomyces sp. NPDC002838 TaxID=3154436 RepID=UPI003320D08E